jgi:hypothetical protein
MIERFLARFIVDGLAIIRGPMRGLNVTTSANVTSEVTLQPIVRQLRDALKQAEAELQRRCFISAEIKQALAVADAFLSRS